MQRITISSLQELANQKPQTYRFAFTKFQFAAQILHDRVGLLTSRNIKKHTILNSTLILLAIVYIIQYISVNCQFPADDAYIHMRIAKNFANYGTPYFNPDQSVSGSSSVFWLLLLSGVFRFGGVNLQAIPLAETLFTIGVFCACTIVLSYRYSTTTSIILSFFLVVIAVMNTAALLMETPAALFFWLLSVVYLRKSSFVPAGFCAGLSFATRYEFVVWIVILMFLIQTPNSRLRAGLAAIIPIGGVALFNLHFFGALLPNTIRAKSTIYTLSLSDSLGTAHIVASLPIFLLLLALNAVLVVYLCIKQKQNVTAGMLLFGTAIIGLYVLRKTFIFPWYIPIFLLPLLLSYCVSYRDSSRFVRLTVAFVAVIFAAAPLLLSLRETQGLALNQHQLYRDYATGLRVRQYLKIGDELAMHYPDALLMTSEIGGLGWAFPGKIMDAVGLVSPECLKYHPMPVPNQRSSGGIGAIPPQAVYDLHPDLIVSMETFSEALRGDMAAQRMTNYRLLANYPVLGEAVSGDRGRLGLWGSRWIQVFVRTPA